MKLKMLKPRMRSLPAALPTLRHNPAATPRMRGRHGVVRRAKWLEQHGLCKHCAEETPPRTTMATEVDHIIPLVQGGADDESNLQSLCRDHHAIKTANEASKRGYRW